jgi:DNA-binding winged helix-turn-helix (wHTH) protein
MAEAAISFGVFRLVTTRRLLLEGDKPVRLGGRAFDILATLVEQAGVVVTKEVLLARVWPQAVVEEANLKIQVSALRRALGDGTGGNRYIVTVPGRGYNFVAPISHEDASPPIRPREIVPPRGNNLPLAIARVIGRDDVVATIVARLSRRRLVTISGPGGIGKSTVALAAAESMIAGHEHGVWLIDMAPLTEPRFVASAVATAVGLEVRAEDPLHGLVAALPPSETNGCCCCSTTVSTSFTPWLLWRQRCSAARQASASWRPAGSRSVSRVKACTALVGSAARSRRLD